MSSFQPSDFGPPFGTDFLPSLQYITNITQAAQAVVTFLNDINYFIGQWISFRVPEANGMIQLNNQKAKIVGLTANTATINVDTRQFYPFIYTTGGQVPCVAVPAGSGIFPGTATVILDDAFDNQPIL